MILTHVRLSFKVCLLLSIRFILLMKSVINILASQLPVIVCLYLLPLNPSPSLVTTTFLSMLSFIYPLDHPTFLLRH